LVVVVLVLLILIVLVVVEDGNVMVTKSDKSIRGRPHKS
jgi:hypothetical protein